MAVVAQPSPNERNVHQISRYGETSSKYVSMCEIVILAKMQHNATVWPLLDNYHQMGTKCIRYHGMAKLAHSRFLVVKS